MKKNGFAKKILKGIGGFFICLFSFVLVIALTLMCAVYIISSGKSPIVENLFVTTVCETGALDFLAYMFNSEEEVEQILANNKIQVPEGDTDVTLIKIRGEGEEEDPEEKEKREKEEEDLGIVYNDQGVCLIDITGKTYVGKLLVVKDPTRVEVSGLSEYGEDKVGKTTLAMANENNALAAINGGGYQEMSDYKTGGIPEGRDETGLVIIDGELKWGNLDQQYEVIGLDRDGILHVDKMTARKALEIGIVDAVNFGPVLVKNGEPCVVSGVSSNVGFHPRSAIGQREDGSILLLVIDGRQAHSLGASYEDLVEIMVKYGAKNAANLDGGMSSYMVYDKEIITSPYMLYFNGKRTVSTSFIVTRKETE